MRKFLPDLRTALLCATVCAAPACHSTAFLGAGMREHPVALVGEWVDSVKSTAADTSLWLLDASGNDGSQHLRRIAGPASPSGPFTATPARHFGYWFFQGALEDSSHRAICFTNRPGRSAPTCLPFDLGSVSTPGGLRRRLVVRSYHGAHTTSDRVLLERLP